MKSKWKVLVFLLLPVILELFLFNFQAVTGRISGDKALEGYSTRYSASMLPQEDGGYICTDAERCYVEILDIDQNVQRLYLDVFCPGEDYVTVEIYGVDEGNSEYYLMGTTNVVQASEESKWLKLHFYGQAKKIKLVFDVENLQPIYFHELQLNSQKPFFIHWERILLFWVLGIFLYVLRGSNQGLWKIDFRTGWKQYRAVTAGVILCLCLSVCAMVQINSPSDEIHQSLAEAFVDGRLYIEEEPPEYLMEMDNPYDFHAREELQAETHELYLWDYAYFEGRYYVYFGVLPVLLLYLPVYLVTGVMLRADLALGMISLLLVFACFYLVREIFRRWFDDCPYILYPILATALYFGTGVVTLLRKPAVYEVCIGAGLVCVLFGIGCWISSGLNEKFSIGKLISGSLLVACTAACRPQFLIGMLLGVVLFLPRFLENGKVCIGKHRTEIIALGAPFLIVAAAVMSYNFVRFHSVFEFGATYNLTTNDVTHRGWNIGRSLYGIYEYLLRPLCIQVQFPFLCLQDMNTSYLGLTIYERHFGGAIWYNPLVFLMFGKILEQKDQKETKVLKNICVCAAVSVLLVVIANTNMGGIVERYQSDFLWILYLLIIIRILCKIRGLEEGPQKIKLRNQIVILTFLTVFLNFLMLWTDDIYDVYDNNLMVFTNMKHLFEIWKG